jgi:hypothetical protein
MIVSSQSYTDFVGEAALTARHRAMKMRNPSNVRNAQVIADLLAAGAKNSVRFDGVFLMQVPIDVIVALAEITLERDAPSTELAS